MSKPVSSIKNLGPASEAMFARVGITSAEQLYELGADPAYRQLLANGIRPHFIGYYVLVMALQGRPWNDCKGDEKAALRKTFDMLVAEMATKVPVGIEAVLDEIGVGRRRA